MDNELFEKLYNTYYIKVYSFLLSLSKDSFISNELTQETFYKAYTTESEFRNNSDVFTYLCSIAKNLLFDYNKKTKRFCELKSDVLSEESIETKLQNKDLALKIHIVIHELKEPYKEVFELRVFGELSFAEIAEIFGKTESFARVTYHRAKLMIKERIDNDEH